VRVAHFNSRSLPVGNVLGGAGGAGGPGRGQSNVMGGGGGHILGGAGPGECALDEETLSSIDALDLSKVCILQRFPALTLACVCVFVYI